MTKKNAIVPRPVHTIATHYSMHLDEIVPLWIARNLPEAEAAFPGISSARVVFWGMGGKTPDGRPAAEWEAKGYYLLGVGGGEGDEHANGSRPRRKDESALSLFIKRIGLADERWLKLTARLVTDEDLYAGTGALSVPSLVKEMNWQFPGKWELVMEWAMMGLGSIMKAELRGTSISPDRPEYKAARKKVVRALFDAAEVLGCREAAWCEPAVNKLISQLGPLSLPCLVMLLEEQNPDLREDTDHWLYQAAVAAMTSQQMFFGPTKEEFERQAKLELVSVNPKERLVLAVVQSDNAQIGKYALSGKGGAADLVVIRNRRGNIRILTRKSQRLDLREIARVIRIMERQANGHKDGMTWRELESAEGAVAGAPNWIFHAEGRMILNGSTTSPDVKPTKLSLADIVTIVKNCLNQQSFDPANQAGCQSGRCRRDSQSCCRWYHYGLFRCRDIRAGRPAAKVA